jgi:hypothetical protein
MDDGIPGDDADMLYSDIPSSEIGDSATGFSDKQSPGRKVPCREVLLPESLKPARGNTRQVKGRSARASNSTGRSGHPAELPQVLLQPRLLLEREAGPDQSERGILDP